jgi:predicted MPP superfamily phosphohydrolase
MPLLRNVWIPALLAALHVYIGMRILPSLPAGAVRLIGILLIVLSFGLMSLSLTARSLWPRPYADRMATPGYFMAGFFSSLLVLTLLRDALLVPVVLFVSHLHAREYESISASMVLGAGILATLVGLVAARRRARIVNVDVPLLNLPPALQGFTIVQISDIHVGTTIRKNYVEKIVKAVNALKPDLIAVTGDMVDGSVRELSAHTAPLGGLRALHGAFFVTGNHEYYSGANAWNAEFVRLGLRVLLNEHTVIEHQGASLVIAGVTDFSSDRFNPSQHSDPHVALAGAPPDASVKILLAHQPRSAPAAASAGFDLQLSGHTHGGQFWPWNLFVRFQQPFTAGLHRLNRLWIYVSRGTGYWGIPNRFGAPSEITRLRLIAAEPLRKSGRRCVHLRQAAPSSA